MYGKHYESMYEGSMYGAGVAVFAVWGYVISHTRDGYLELNPRKLADTLGGTTEEITRAIEFLTQPDPRSRHKEYEGRRLIKEGEFQYRVPSWESYQRLKSEIDRREYNRMAKQRERDRKRSEQRQKREHPKPVGKTLVEALYEQAMVKCDQEAMDKLTRTSGGEVES